MRIVLPGDAEIRTWRLGDAPSVARHADDREVWINLRDAFPHPYRRADAESHIRTVLAAEVETSFALVIGGEAAGGVGLNTRRDVYRRTAEIGYWLGRAHWGRGIATAAVRALTEWGFATHDVCRIQAEVFAWNPASMRVLEKAGFERESTRRQSVTKAGQTIDAHLYVRFRP